MKLYDPIISDILTLCQNSTARNLPVCSVDWPDLGKENLIFRQDMAYELGGSGHTSIAEHASFTFGLEGVSRTLLAQITRHRVASFSVQSQRYVSVAGAEVFDYVLPPRIRALGPEAEEKFAQQMKTMQRWYDEWSEALGQDSAEDARFVLPGAAATRIVMTMNARELLHFFSLRMCNRAQWEVREAAWRMYELVYPLAPSVFELAGPGCARGGCPEGKRSCGRAAEVREKIQGLREKQ